VLLSTTEGEDKPLKYAVLYKTADLVLITKIDLAVAAGFDVALARRNVAAVNPRAEVLEVSACTGAGMAAWYDRLRCQRAERA
jgi:hydrogenase nickel incorporation protein HypB